MKAAVFQALGQPLSIAEVESPRPQRDQVLLKICRCGICGSDLHMTAEPVFGISSGYVLGHEISGEVIEAGPGADDLKPGDQVSVAPLNGCGKCSRCLAGEPAWCESMQLIGGGYAEYAAIAGRQCRKLPWGISASDGALAEPLAVSLHGVRRSGMRPGDRVLGYTNATYAELVAVDGSGLTHLPDALGFYIESEFVGRGEMVGPEPRRSISLLPAAPVRRLSVPGRSPSAAFALRHRESGGPVPSFGSNPKRSRSAWRIAPG